MIKVTVWHEYCHEKHDERAAALYPKGIHGCIADFLGEESDLEVRTATLDMPECGLTDEVLGGTDVLLWWGHTAHDRVPDSVAQKVHQQVLKGMGFIALHSAHYSKPFRLLMGTSCSLRWREGDRERVWTVLPAHPIAAGIGDCFEIENEEMYGECFDIPAPDENVFIGWFEGGEVFRSGCTWRRGYGKVFYFQPGHESNPTFYIPEVQRILKNAVRWAAPVSRIEEIDAPWTPSPEKERRSLPEEIRL